MQNGGQATDKPQVLPLGKKDKKKKEKGFKVFYSDRMLRMKKRAAKSF